MFIVASVILSVAGMIYYEDFAQSDYEECQEGCGILHDKNEQLECLLDCNELFGSCTEGLK